MRCFSFVSCAFRSEKFKLAAQANASQVCILKFKWHYLLWQNNQCSASLRMCGCCVCVCAMYITAAYKVQQKRHLEQKKKNFLSPHFSEPIRSSHKFPCSGKCLCLDLMPWPSSVHQNCFNFSGLLVELTDRRQHRARRKLFENKRHRRRRSGTYELSVSSFKYSTVHRVHSSRFAATHSLAHSHIHEHDRQALHVTLSLHSPNLAKVVQLWCESCLI